MNKLKLALVLALLGLAALCLIRLAVGAEAVQPFDIAASGTEPCGGLVLMAWPIQSDMPGISLDPDGPYGVTLSYHSFVCTETGPAAVFHVAPSTDIVGLCVTQELCSEDCAILFGEGP